MKPCAHCGEEFAPYRSTSKFCSRRCSWNSRTVKRSERPCHKCGASVAVKVGLAVCDDCRVDPRDPERSRAKERARTLRGFGLTEAQYDAMLNKQGQVCAICQTTDPGGRGNWCIDHCHETGVVRGLLCVRCNSGLGFFDDNPHILSSARDYLLIAATNGGKRAWWARRREPARRSA
jgi:hypothetical protein